MVSRRRGSSSTRARRSSTWDCKACCDQMVGAGPRCYEHNPTPEQREADPAKYAPIDLRSSRNGKEAKSSGIPDPDDDADR